MKIILCLIFLLGSISAYSGDVGSALELDQAHPFYVGLNGGYGSTLWKGLVPRIDNQSLVLQISTPIDVYEGGLVWGGVAGFDFSSFFGVEVNYLKYPNATVFFDESSLFSFENDGQTQLNTQTETVSLMAKWMLNIPNTLMRAYSSVGVGWIHREDNINDVWLVTPSFGLGLNYSLSTHFMGEIAANYMSGYGESELNPVNDFIPFLYAVYFRLAYRI